MTYYADNPRSTILRCEITSPDFISSIAPEAVEVREDHLVFPVGALLPLSARGAGVPGMADCPWSRLSADLFYTNLPLLYSLTLRREPPDTLRGSLRARRTPFEGVMLALAERALHHFQPGGQLFPGLNEPLLFLEETLPLMPAPASKRGVGLTLITYLPADLMKNPTSLSLASTAFIGRLGPEEAFAFFRSLGVPETEARKNAEMVSRLPPRVFLAAPSGGRGALFPVMVTIPPVWLEYMKTSQLGVEWEQAYDEAHRRLGFQ